jgi:uncharacterized protein YbjT (DUF2867 family)
MKTAIVIGGTGLVGSCLINELLTNDNYNVVKSFVRKPTGLNHSKLSEHVIDFENLEKFKELFSGDDLFICLGTTIKKAGSVTNMEKIDRDYPIQIAQIFLNNGVRGVAVVSSVGAKKNSKNYYLRIKGEMEDGIIALPYRNTAILRPSLLLGNRKEKRLSEFMSKGFMTIFSFLFIGKIRKFRAIHAKTVARAMIRILENDRKDKIYESDLVQAIGE